MKDRLLVDDSGCSCGRWEMLVDVGKWAFLWFYYLFQRSLLQPPQWPHSRAPPDDIRFPRLKMAKWQNGTGTTSGPVAGKLKANANKMPEMNKVDRMAGVTPP